MNHKSNTYVNTTDFFGSFCDRRPVREDIYRAKRSAITALSGSTDHTILQGGCYVTSTGHFVLAITNASFNSVIVVELDTDYKTVMKRIPMDIGHANDFAYNPNTDKIYVATGNTGTNANRIAVLNARTLVLETTLPLDSTTKWLCSYDEINDQYYTIGSGYIRVYDGEWHLIRSLENTLADSYKGKGKMTYQSSFCYDGKFITLSFSNETFNGSLQISGIFLQVVNVETGAIDSTAQYTPCDNSDEPEFIAVIGDIAYMFGGQLFFQVSKLYLNPETLYESDTNIFGAAKLIPQGEDLNACLAPGTYYSPNTAYTAGLTNVPTKVGFTLYVLPTGRGIIVQELTNSGGNTYRRTFGNTTGEFDSWKLMDKCRGPRYTYKASASSQTVTMNSGGACFVVLTKGSSANLYFVNVSGSTSYLKTLISQISGVTTAINGLKVTFNRSDGITLFVWKME